MKNIFINTLVLIFILSISSISYGEVFSLDSNIAGNANDYKLIEVESVAIGQKVTIKGKVEIHITNKKAKEFVVALWSDRYQCYFFIEKTKKNRKKLYKLKGKIYKFNGTVTGVRGSHFWIYIKSAKRVRRGRR